MARSEVEEIAIKFVADLDAFKKQMAEREDIESDSYQQSVKGYLEAVKAQRKADAKAARAKERENREREKAEKEAKKAIEDGSKALLNQIPIVGDLTGVFEDMFGEIDFGSASFLGLETNAKGLIGLTAGIAAVGAAVYSIRKAAEESRQQIAQLNQTTGLLPETLGAIKLAGGEDLLNTMGEAAGEFQKRMADAAQGTGEAKAVFDRLGISATDAAGNLRSSDEVMREFVTTLQQSESPVQAAADATTVFGGAGRELMAALGTTTLDDWVKSTEHFGYDVGPEAIQATKDWDTATRVFGSMWESLSEDLVGYAMSFSDELNNIGMGIVGLKAGFGALMAGDIDGFWTKATEAAGQYKRMLQDTKTASEGITDAGISQADMVDALGLGYQDTGTKAAEANKAAASGHNTARTAAKNHKTAVDEVGEAALTAQEKMAQLMATAGRDGYAGTIFDDGFEWSSTFQDQADAASAAISGTLDEDKIRRAAFVEGFKSDMGEVADHLGTVADVAGAFTDQASGIMSSIGELTKRRFGEDSKEYKKTMRDLFHAQKAIAISNVIISGAQAVMQGFAAGGPVLGGIMAPIVAANTALQIAVIAGEQPSFHTGGIIGGGSMAPDERGITALTGEGVVSRRGMAALENINRGGPMAGGQPVVVYGAKVFDAVSSDLVNLPSSAMSRAIRRKTRRRVGHRS